MSPDNSDVQAVAGALAFNHESAYSSGSAGITTYDGIFPATADPSWTTTQCGPTPIVGPNAAWQNPHAPFVVGSGYPLNTDPLNYYVHPWLNNVGVGGATFTAPRINSWNSPSSMGPGGQSWTKHSITVTGTGQHVVQLLADNCSWIYLDGNIVGVQGVTDSPAVYPVTLTGTQQLTFIIFDGGGAAGGKFRLETRESFIAHGGNPDLLPPPLPPSPPQVTPGSICALVQQWVSQKGVANSMCQQLKNGAYAAFRNHVSAQSGRFVSAANAATLIALSQSL